MNKRVVQMRCIFFWIFQSQELPRYARGGGITVRTVFGIAGVSAIIPSVATDFLSDTPF